MCINKTKCTVIAILVALLHAMQIQADTEVYVGKLCFRCFDETMTAELTRNRFCENPVNIVVPKTVEADGKVYTVTAIGDNPFIVPVESVQLPPTIKRIGNKAFPYSKLEEIVLPDSIETIGEDAFGYGDDIPCLTRVVFPKKVKRLKIGDRAFEWCPIEELTLPEGLTELGNSSFSYTKIRTLTIPSSVKSIPDFCFCACENLESVNLPEGIEYIGICAFANTQLQRFEIPSTVKEIGAAPFSAAPIKEISIPATFTHWPRQFLYGTAIESINIPEGVVEIGDECFKFCSNLKSITIPASAKFVGTGIASFCDALTTLTIPSSLEVLTGDPQIPQTAQVVVAGNDNKIRQEDGMLINDRGEDGCWLLTVPDGAITDGKFTVPDGINALGNNVFCSRPLKELANAEAIEYIGSSALAETNITAIDMPRLKGLGKEAFSECSSLRSITLPEGLKEIPYYCFYKCYALGSVNLPATIESIGAWAFNRSAINQINFPEGLKEIGNGAFSSSGLEYADVPSSCTIFHFNGSKVRTVRLHEGLTAIPSHAFNGCSSLESINLPSTLRSIDEQAFVACKNLQEITLPEGLTTLAFGAFALSGLTSVVVPESVSEIGACAFQECPLTFCDIKSPLKEIPEAMFYKCDQLKQVVLPNTVEQLGMWAFWADTSLEDLNIPSSIKDIEYAAMVYCNISHLSLPASVERLGEYCFGGIQSVSVDFSQTSLTELPDYAFVKCENLRQITLPSTLTRLSDNFSASPQIERVECRSANPPVVEGETFDENVFSQAALIVPEGCENDYRTAEVWKKFATISTPAGLTAPTCTGMKETSKIYDLRGLEMKTEKGIYIKGGKVRINK